MSAGTGGSVIGQSAAGTRAGDRFVRPMLRQIPRLLTQVDRNPHSPTYGSCCRNYWHYRIEDISNSQLQELVLTLALAHASNSHGNPYRGSDRLLEWIRAILEYTLRLQRATGSFDEVYRGQDSYAATAFVTFTHTETLLRLRDRLDPALVDRMVRAFERSAGWLAATRESFAANQMAGAAAALFNVAELTGDETHARTARRILEAVKSSQSDEGWFDEYGGADIGYGSLTASYLALIAHRTGDPTADAMAAASLSFVRWFLHDDGTAGGEYGSRNTEYLVPVAPVLMAERNAAAAVILDWLRRGLDGGSHAIITDGLDDRYLAYLSPFYMLAGELADDAGDSLAPPMGPDRKYFPESGMLSVRTAGYHVVAGLKKGGVLRCTFGGVAQVDDGIWGRLRDGRTITSQQLDRSASVTESGDAYTICGALHVRKPIVVTPFRNILVRGYNLTMPAWLRRRFLDFVRNMAVSAGGPAGRFTRTIRLHSDRIEIEDRVEIDAPVDRLVVQLERERAFSFASTGFYQAQELGCGDGVHDIRVGPDGTGVASRSMTREGVVFGDA